MHGDNFFIDAQTPVGQNNRPKFSATVNFFSLFWLICKYCILPCDICAIGCLDDALNLTSATEKMHLVKWKSCEIRMHLLSLGRMQIFKSCTPINIHLNGEAREMRKGKA